MNEQNLLCPDNCIYLELATGKYITRWGTYEEKIKIIEGECTLYKSKLQGNSWKLWKSAKCLHNESICPNCGEYGYTRIPVDTFDLIYGFIDKWRCAKCK